MFFRVRGTPDNAIAFYPFNGNADDQSGRGHHGAVTGAQLTTDRHGTPNAAYAFNGASDRITVAYSPALDITGPVTLAAWIAPESLSSWDAWVSRENSAGNRSQWRASFGGGAHEWGLTWWNIAWRDRWINDPLPSGQWSHVVIAADPSAHTIRLFRNGEEKATLTGETIDFQPSTGLLYLAYQSDKAVYFHGKIDEVRIYDRALTRDEILCQYLATRP